MVDSRIYDAHDVVGYFVQNPVSLISVLLIGNCVVQRKRLVLIESVTGVFVNSVTAR
jgi:hypothetical protein